MVNAHSDVLTRALNTEPRVLTAQFQVRLAAYNTARRDALDAGCTIINEQPDALRGIEVAPCAAGVAFVSDGGCTRRVLPSGGTVVHRLHDGVMVMYAEDTQ